MQHSTGYIIGFAAAVCLVCALVVSSSAVLLKDRQAENVLLDRQIKVLDVAGLIGGKSISREEVQRIFGQNIQPRIVNLETGEYDESIDADSFDQRRASKDPAQSTSAPPNDAKVRRLPINGLIYHVVQNDKLEAVILPIEGMGLWSTLYGYIALAPDTRTVQGITFYQHGETPGLGGEVDNPRWKKLWQGRQAFDKNWRPAISVIKGNAGSVEEDPTRIDGLAGATLTSRGVHHLVRFWLGDNGFGPYLANFRTERGI